MMWAEKKWGHVSVWWRGQLIYKSYEGGQPSWVFDPYGPPWQLPKQKRTAPFGAAGCITSTGQIPDA